MIHHLQTLFKAHSDKMSAEKQSKYMRGLFPFHGIPKPVREELEKKIFKEHLLKNEEELHQTLLALWEQKEREFHYAALSLSKKYKKHHSLQALSLFEKLIRTHSWWDTVDDLASNHVGALIKRYPEGVKAIDMWIEDPHLWIRRTAILYQLKYKGDTDKARLFTYCEKTMHEKDFFIRKAIGWCLREYSKTNPQAVKEFIRLRQETLSPLSIREGSKYI